MSNVIKLDFSAVQVKKNSMQ